MVEGVAFIIGGAVAASLLQTQSTNLIVIGAVIVGGIFAWRQKRGDFYKAVAEEKKEENVQLREERDRLREMTDITPIVKVLERVTAALERNTATNGEVVSKLAEMNGSVRAHGEAMKALGDRLIVDEAARALLATAAGDKPEHQRRTT